MRLPNGQFDSLEPESYPVPPNNTNASQQKSSKPCAEQTCHPTPAITTSAQSISKSPWISHSNSAPQPSRKRTSRLSKSTPSYARSSTLPRQTQRRQNRSIHGYPNPPLSTAKATPGSLTWTVPPQNTSSPSASPCLSVGTESAQKSTFRSMVRRSRVQKRNQQRPLTTLDCPSSRSSSSRTARLPLAPATRTCAASWPRGASWWSQSSTGMVAARDH